MTIVFHLKNKITLIMLGIVCMILNVSKRFENVETGQPDG